MIHVKYQVLFGFLQPLTLKMPSTFVAHLNKNFFLSSLTNIKWTCPKAKVDMSKSKVEVGMSYN